MKVHSPRSQPKGLAHKHGIYSIHVFDQKLKITLYKLFSFINLQLVSASLSHKSFTNVRLKDGGELNLCIQLCNTKSYLNIMRPVSSVEMQNLKLKKQFLFFFFTIKTKNAFLRGRVEYQQRSPISASILLECCFCLYFSLME